MPERELTTAAELSAESRAFMEDLQKETPRGGVLVAAAYLNDVLESMLAALFRDEPKAVGKLLKENGPLWSFSSKIQLCYCLGMIDETIRDDLNIINRIRRKFAHRRRPARMEDSDIRRWCGSLKTVRMFRNTGLYRLLKGPGDRFLLTVAVLTMKLHAKALRTKRVTLK